MGIWELVNKDLQFITATSGDFPVDLTFTTPDGLTTVTVKGLSSKHSLVIGGDGAPMVGRNTHASVSEAILVAASYPVRNGNNEVDMKDHRITWTDISGVAKTYKIKVQMPDEKIGLLLFPELTDYKP